MKKFLFLFMSLTVLSTSYLFADCKTDFPIELKKQYHCLKYQYLPTGNGDGSAYRVVLSQVQSLKWIRGTAPCTFIFRNGSSLTLGKCYDAPAIWVNYLNYFKDNPDFVSIP